MVLAPVTVVFQGDATAEAGRSWLNSSSAEEKCPGLRGLHHRLTSMERRWASPADSENNAFPRYEPRC